MESRQYGPTNGSEMKRSRVKISMQQKANRYEIDIEVGHQSDALQYL